MHKQRVIALAMLWSGFFPAAAAAQDRHTPLSIVNRFTGDQPLRFDRGGTPLRPEGARLAYRKIRSEAEWKRVWGYLYDDMLKVDFSRHVVLAIYRSPANGAFDFRPTRAFKVEDTFFLDLNVVWKGTTAKRHPFLFLVVEDFAKLEVNERFSAPAGRDVRYP
jgi:hypothetical protein